MEHSVSLATIFHDVSSYKAQRVKNQKVKYRLNSANDIYYEYYDTIEPYFAFRMKELDECYTEPKYTFANHFKKVNREVTSCRMDMTAENFVNFFKTYSGYNTYLKQTGRDVAE